MLGHVHLLLLFIPSPCGYKTIINSDICDRQIYISLITLFILEKYPGILNVIARPSHTAHYHLHYPSVVEKNDKGQKKRRRCILCSSRGLGQKRSDVFCSICPGRPALCPDFCFTSYHSNII